MRPIGPTLACALVCLAATGTAACTVDEPEAADTGCAATVREASFATEVDEQIALLDTALLRCRSYGALIDEMERYPGIVGYELATFVELRCEATDDDAVRRAPACAGFGVTGTSVGPVSQDLVFVGTTLDGRTVEIRPDADTTFVGEYPEVVQRTVDLATEQGCPAVIAERDRWAARTAEPGFGDEASVYANHAQNVAQFIGCTFTLIGGAPGTTAPATTAPTVTGNTPVTTPPPAPPPAPPATTAAPG